MLKSLTWNNTYCLRSHFSVELIFNFKGDDYIMIKLDALEAFKEIAPIFINSIPGGAVFAVTDKDSILWKLASDSFDTPVIEVGNKVRSDGAVAKCLREGRVIIEKGARNIYGIRLFMTSIPVYDDGQAVRSLSILMPRLHPIARAFTDIAPLIANMFAEGAFLYVSDLDKIVYRQPSDKFDIPDLQVDEPLKENFVSYRSVKSRQMEIDEIDASVYGIPVISTSVPFFDEADDTFVVGSFNIITPKENAVILRNLSTNLTKSLEEISIVIEQLAASASQISINEKELNQKVLDVNRLADQISEVLNFIKQIADETKMLGLNAAIEAARAGETGRGFGVVAEEIRKLSDESKETVSSIRTLINNIKDDVKETGKYSELTLRSSEEQAAASQEITASIEEITGMANELEKMALKM